MVHSIGIEPMTPCTSIKESPLDCIQRVFIWGDSMPDLFKTVSAKLNAELQMNHMGKNRLYKFVLNCLGSHDQVLNFFVKICGWKRHEVSDAKYKIEYRKKRYQLEKLNRPRIDKSN